MNLETEKDLLRPAEAKPISEYSPEEIRRERADHYRALRKLALGYDRKGKHYPPNFNALKLTLQALEPDVFQRKPEAKGDIEDMIDRLLIKNRRDNRDLREYKKIAADAKYRKAEGEVIDG